MAATSKSRDLSLRTSPTFIDGVLLCAGAVRDSLLVFRSGTCLLERIGQLFDEHDLTHTLTGTDGKGRLALTLTDASAMTMGADKSTQDLVGEAVKRLKPGVVMLSELSMVTLAGEDLRDLARNLSRRYGLPVVAAATRSLERDWQDAFESILCGLAENVPVAQRDPRTVALFGLFCERGEGDWEGNWVELERMTAAVGLRMTLPWLCNGTYKELAQAGRAGRLLALPAGRRAAQILARRSQAEVVPVDLPVGLAGASAWLRRLAGRQAEKFIKAEIGFVVPRLDRVLLRHLAGKHVALIATEDWLRVLPPFFARELGMIVPVMFSRQRFSPGKNGVADAYDPSVESLNAALLAARRRGGLDLIIGSHWERNVLSQELRDVPFMEFGYPCRASHFLTPTPFLGFRGVLTWAEQLTERLLLR